MSDAPITRRYQTEAIEAVDDAISFGTVQRTLLVMATGCGKTWTFSRILVRRRDQGYGRALVLAHRIELVDQAAGALESAGLSVEVESGDRLAHVYGSLLGAPSDVVVATVQSLRGRRLERWPADAFGTVIIDECHRATAQGYREVLDRFPAAKVVGVTATPDRADGVGLGNVFSHVAYQYDMRQAIAEGYLCPLRVYALTSAELDLASVRVTRQEHGRDLNAEDLAAQLGSGTSLHALASQIVGAVGERPTIVFTPSVMMAHQLADVMVSHTAAGVRALDGGSGKDDRAKALDDYREGRVQYLLNCALFTEGFDAPRTSAVVVLRPTKSRSLYAQMIGRGTRLFPGKDDCLVCDLTTNADNHTLATPLDVLAGREIPDDVRKLAQSAIADGQTVDEALAAAEEAARKKEELRQARRQRKAATKIKATALYESRMVDPWRDDAGAPRTPSPEERDAWTLQRMCERLIKSGVKVPMNVTRELAEAWLAQVNRRREAGLCSFKQAGWLRRQGLRWENVSHLQAKHIMNVARHNGWRVPADIRREWGA